jgi:gluconate 2-dehydrogenase gamma chain
MSQTDVTRRGLLTGTAAIGSVLALGQPPVEAKSISGEVPWDPGLANAPSPIASGPLQFLTADEAAFIDAAISRLIPTDELGPGAKEAGVTTFIDRQLAGHYGRAERWYMQGPWKDGSKSQGYQLRFTPAQLYRAAIKAVDAHCQQMFQGKRFAELDAKQQEKVLEDLENGAIKLDGADAGTFFAFLRQNTIEGFFADPMYGGNKDMVGWKLVGFPGARYNYLPYVTKHNQKLDLPPVAIMGRPDWTPHS